jgi:membrane protein
LFLASILIDSFEVLAGGYIDDIFSGKGRFFTSMLNEVTGALVVTMWFIVLFRYIADGRPAWRVVIAGGILTGILFSAGKALLSFLMRNSNIGTIYGASGSFVLLLLLVFYFSFILYYGASFIKVYAASLNLPVKLLGHAFHYQLREIN